MSSSNNIIYIEPNKLPGEYAAKSSGGVKKDNITWNPEDLNIFVDLQVVFPSRIYRESNKANIYERETNMQSILSGVKLTQDKSFLTDDYTSVCYQEIKNNSAGSVEMLGINSIHIVFDSHMYPRVTMNFTDVRAASLMMPQEQFEYDMHVKNDRTGEDKVCRSFFQSFFKFPYPKFYLSVKGVYGTCVTFVLSVEDFKATFNSETGNFDVVVTFIGLMYGLYTDVPMNYLFIAPYIGSSDGITNAYWQKQTSENGNFFFSEKGEQGNPICTFFDFVRNYRELVDITQNKDGFVLGENMTKFKDLEDKSRLLSYLEDYYNNISQNCKSNHVKITLNKGYITLLFMTDSNLETGSVTFNEGFVTNFSSAYSTYCDKYGVITGVNEDDIPMRIANGKNVAQTIQIDEFYTEDDNNGRKIKEGGKLYNALIEIDSTASWASDLNNAINAQKIYAAISTSKNVLIYTNKFETAVRLINENVREEIEWLSDGLSEETKELFRNSCGFTPSIENIMRMIFAHLDTFMHEFYAVLKEIGNNGRLLGNKWAIENTDILSTSSSNVKIPPFTAFYKNNPKNKRPERVYPGYESSINNLEEVNFVNSIFHGLDSKLSEEAEYLAKKSAENEVSFSIDDDNVDYKFTPIAITDYFYPNEPQTPYSMLEVNDPYELWYYFLCRLYVGLRDYEGKKEYAEKIVEIEFENLKNSSLWNRILKEEVYRSTLDKGVFMSALNNNSINPKHRFGNIFKIKQPDSKFNKYIVSKCEDYSDFYKFYGLDNMHGKDCCREKLDRFQIKPGTNSRINNFISKIKGFDTNEKEYLLKKQVEDTYFFGKYVVHITALLKDDNNIPISDGAIRVNGGVIEIPSSSDIDGTGNYNIYDFLYKSERSKLWIPAVSTIASGYGNKGYRQNIFFEKEFNGKNYLFTSEKGNEKIIYNKALWFLYHFLQDVQTERFKTINDLDKIYHLPYAYLLFIGGYFYFEEIEIVDKEIKEAFKHAKEISPDFLDEEKKRYLKNIFAEWVEGSNGNKGEFETLLTEIKKENEEAKKKNWKTDYELSYYAPNTAGVSAPLQYKIPTLSPSNGTAQNILQKLISEHNYILSFPTKHDKNGGRGTTLIELEQTYLDSFVKKINESVLSVSNEENKTSFEIEYNGFEEENDLISLYYTLKNLYDRWLSSYSEKNFKLKSVSEEKAAKKKKNTNYYSSDSVSEFDNFLYVDSFYNDIGKEFIVNPGTFYSIVTEQINGNTNYNILEFIGKICQENKLLFRCLPVYNNLYSESTFKDIFTPLSLYDGMNRIHRRIGNTYLLMYPYEPSSKLSLYQERENDMAYKDDSFLFADSFENVTTEAKELFNVGGDAAGSICAFGVTPGAQNQSYFTKVSIGMDNPRVTDISIKNKFELAAKATGGRMEGIGTGQDLFSLYSNRSYDCNVEMLGCANIMPMMYFQLNNVPMFKGAYMITKVEHNIQNNAMTTKFTGTRMNRFFIPFNTKVFSIREVSELIAQLQQNGSQSYLRYYEGTGFSINGEKYSRVEGVPQPSSDHMYDKNFNVWAAVSQMLQVMLHKDDTTVVPRNNRTQFGLCATAVELFLMAGFFGLCQSNNKSEAIEIDKLRQSKGFKGYDGYKMREQLANLGFECIVKGAETIKKFIDYYQVGDVIVIEEEGKTPGHVCMFDGKSWVSDYYQRGGATDGWDTNRTISKGEESVLLYRYPHIETNKKLYVYFKDNIMHEGVITDETIIDSLVQKQDNSIDS